MIQSAANTASVTSALGRNSGANRVLVTISGDTMTVAEIAEFALETLIRPKMLNTPWWPILGNNLEDHLREWFVFLDMFLDVAQ